MKKIYFDNISDWKKNWLKLSLLILSLILLFIGIFADIFSENLNKWIKATGFLFIGLFYMSKLIRKNYVQWNKIGMTVRINSYFREKRLTFNEINSYKFMDDILLIIQSNKTIQLDLNNIIDSDKKRLIQIIADNTVANNS